MTFQRILSDCECVWVLVCAGMEEVEGVWEWLGTYVDEDGCMGGWGSVCVLDCNIKFISNCELLL